eukprot:gnl/TRDRNA2_/TRDRNA2_162730_c0_seq1.p1 gnl/TRDRNA2_/TRDRNA2_162730_c0~~gnl/TRDRNA2_/TRDRNA2_162730_c0_seq1.p1  ORF type:complete len:231 (+),score=31.41 gnl/TRDRNA2_/TRDRNA2_162730_c0_seq1:134-826(+)
MSKDVFQLEDTVLTPLGQYQARSLCEELHNKKIGLVVSSTLDSALQTACLAFPTPPGGRIIAHEGVREIMCPPQETASKRRAISEKRAMFPRVDWSEVVNDEDLMWTDLNGEAETAEQVLHRMQSFLTWLLHREERVIAVVSHKMTLSQTFSPECVQKLFETQHEDYFGVMQDKSLYYCHFHEVVMLLRYSSALNDMLDEQEPLPPRRCGGSWCHWFQRCLPKARDIHIV